MNKPISRRNFLKIAGLSTGLGAVLTGCGPASRYVVRQPYLDMPEYTQTGKSTFFASTCGECSAGCGLIVRTMEGRAHKVEGNPAHPVSHGATCSRGQAILQGVYNPDRIQDPGKQASRGSGNFTPIQWDEAVSVVKDALQGTPPDQIAFLMGLFPDHLNDLVQLISSALGGIHVLRYGPLGEFEGRETLKQAAGKLFGSLKIPAFDFKNAEMVFSFGANFVETWLSPVSYAFEYGLMRQGHTGQRGYLVQFEPRMSQTAANADEWYPILPGSEAILAQGLGRLIAELKSGGASAVSSQVNIAEIAAQTGVAEADLQRLAELFTTSSRPLALPGGIPLGSQNGLAAAESILALNLLVDNLGKEGGVYFLPDPPVYPDLPYGPDPIVNLTKLISKMGQGEIKVLFVHNANPIFDLPISYKFSEALAKVPRVISFASFPDETAQQADFILPDHTPLESWGYQKVVFGSDRFALSGLQPVVVPLHNTRATADVLLAAVQSIGGQLAQAIHFTNEVDFLQQSIAALADQGGFYTAPAPESFWELWQQYGGWWKPQPDWGAPPARTSFDQTLTNQTAQFSGDASEFPFYLLPFPSPNLAEGSVANRPVLQEAPDPMTTVMWNSWVEVSPLTMQKLGLKDDDVVKISSSSGEVEAVVYGFPGIHPDVVAVPLGQGHTALGRYAQGRGFNPQDLLVQQENQAGQLAFMATRVKIQPTGKSHPLSRYESKEGVYGSRNFFEGA